MVIRGMVYYCDTNMNDFTTTEPWESLVKGNHPQMVRPRLVNYSNLPRNMAVGNPM